MGAFEKTLCEFAPLKQVVEPFEEGLLPGAPIPFITPTLSTRKIDALWMSKKLSSKGHFFTTSDQSRGVVRPIALNFV